MKETRAALFDLDGVVFDTESQYTIFWGKQSREFHPEIPDLEHKIKGQTLTEIFEKYYSGELQCKREVIVERLAQFEASMHFEYVSGFESFVRELRSLGIKTAVVTSSNKKKMEEVYIKHPEFKSYFDIILTSEDFLTSKPSPECYLKAADTLSVPHSKCAVFEDSFNGLKSGRAANMKVIGLSTTNSKESITPFADMVIPDFNGLAITDIY